MTTFAPAGAAPEASAPGATPYVTAAGARAAATLLLLRDGADGLEVLMLRRAERPGDPWSGAAVFPGGVIDARDAQAHAHCTGLDDAQASARLGMTSGGLDYAVAAVRETFEEVGLLLADAPVDLQALRPWREQLQSGRAGVAELCAAAGVRLDLRGLVYCGHWLTPPGLPKRFDTRFFAAQAPADQQPEADQGEAAALMWPAPARALSEAMALKLVPVTRAVLKELAGHASVDAALQAYRDRREVPLMMPRRALTAQGPGVVMPGERAYAEVGRLDPDGRGDVHATLQAGRVVRLSDHVLRITAPNAGPMTGPGTNTYLVGGDGRWTAIDPGPVSEPHLQALLAALAAADGRLERILVTHTHRDHSPGAAALAAATGAPVWGRVADHPEWQDEHFQPAHVPVHGEHIDAGPGATLRVLHTPGHASNHLCYLLEQERLLFTGDHVMQGSTVVINPPDGDMAVYLQSLQALQHEALHWLAPGHGFLVGQPQAVLRGLIAHRLRREAKVLQALRSAGAQGPVSLERLLPEAYDDVPAALHPVARRSLLAHLIKLQGEGAACGTAEGWSAG